MSAGQAEGQPGATTIPILVLDDEAEITKSIARDLRQTATAQLFTDADEALAAVETGEYSVIICDLKMPGMSGLEFLSRCAQIKPDAQRILLTAHADLANLGDSINRARLNRLMTKPWEATDLQEIVSASIRSYEVLRENTELRRLALTDALTGVANHRYFWERLDSEFSRAQRYNRGLSLIMGDVDDFKKFNDLHGHQVGDDVLRRVATTLERGRRSMDTVARYGGEEFGIILPEATANQAVEIAHRHLERIKQTENISLSFGVASFPEDAKSPTELVYKADLAMLKAKNQGKGRVLAHQEPPAT